MDLSILYLIISNGIWYYHISKTIIKKDLKIVINYMNITMYKDQLSILKFIYINFEFLTTTIDISKVLF
jgi:hypothetical protein